MKAEGGYQNSRVSFGNHVLIMNLAVADLLMGNNIASCWGGGVLKVGHSTRDRKMSG